jgi:Fur family ferric uptake transcriptional regulator
MVRARLPKISLGTVYRNLELLVEMGAIQKLEMGGPESRFDGNAGHHHHIRCERCGRVDDLGDVPEALTDVLAGARLAHTSGYEILGYRLVFSGICPECGKKQPDGAN